MEPKSPVVRRKKKVKVEALPALVPKNEYFGTGGNEALAKPADVQDGEYLQVQTSNKMFQFYQDYVKPAASRDQVYVQIEDMSYDSIVNSVLELYAEDAFGDVLEGKDNHIWCSCLNSKVRDIVDEFLESSGILERVWSITFQHIKYGDHFVKVDGERGHGVTNLDYDIHPKLIKRYEKNGSLFAFSSAAFSQDHNEVTYFTPWQFAHFRNGTQRLRERLFYGSIKEGTYGDPLLSQSILTWRKLNMMEDSMVLYRNAKISRPMIVKINMDAVPKAQQREYFDRVINRFEYTSSFSPNESIYQQQAKALSASEPIYIPMSKDGGDITHEDWSEDPSVSGIIDIEYMRNKLYGSFKVPPPFIGITADMGGLNSDNLYMMSMRYARTVRRIKMQVLWGIKRICRIHLAYRDPLLLRHDFDLNTASVTTAEDLSRAETTKTIIGFLSEFARLLEGVGVEYDRYKFAKWAIKHLNLNDFDVNDILKKVETELGAAPQGTPMGGALGGVGGGIDLGAPAPVPGPEAGPAAPGASPMTPGAMPPEGIPLDQFLAQKEKTLGEIKMEKKTKLTKLFGELTPTDNKDVTAATPDKYEDKGKGKYDFKEVRKFVRVSDSKGKSKEVQSKE